MPSFSAGGEDDAPPPSPSSKGKAPMAAEGVACGICLTDSRRAIRGELDCCAHHFCFVCIMAWARVESRCPFCKAVFRTIRRPPVPGRLPSHRVVTVAQRIQVWHPLGNESSVVGADPSVNSGCSVCSCTNDEDLLLLCELCDVAAHTYCVGLGTTVPEGDWFCNDCATSKEEHSRRCLDVDDAAGYTGDQEQLDITIEVPTAQPATDRSRSGTASSVSPANAPSSQPVPVRSAYGNTNGTIPARARSSGPFQVPSIYDEVEDEDYGTDPAHGSSGPVPSIYDIVDDDDSEARALRRAGLRSARADRKSDDSSSDESLYLGSPQERKRRRPPSVNIHAGFGTERARTLRNSRNIGNRIMELRENWSAIRAGSAGFGTHLRSNGRENGTCTVSANTVDQQSRTASTRETATVSGHANRISPKDTRHVNKAWRMLEMAKSGGERKKCDKPSSLDCTPRFSMGNRSTSFSPIDAILGQKNQTLSTLVPQRNTVKHDRGAKKDSTLPKKDIEAHRNVLENCHASVLERTGSFQDRMVNQESPNGKVASSSHSQHVDQTPKSSCGSKVASSSHRQHVGQTSESLCGSSGSGRPKMDVVRPFSNSLSSGRPMVTSPLQFVSSSGSQSGMMVNPEEPPAVEVTTSSEIGTGAATVEVKKSSGSDRHGSKRKLRFETSDDQESKKLKKSSKIAKTEISSMALRELKMLKIDKTYGSEKFKEIARAATHTVLASCGLEHTPSVALSVLPKPVCKHSRRTEPPKLSVVANTCKKCLCEFVKQTIGSVLSGNQMDQAAASC